MKKQNYRVKKKIDLYEFIKAHKEERGWDNMSDACNEFRQDVKYWTTHWNPTWSEDIGDLVEDRADGKVSRQFIPHLEKYGFIEEVKEEVTYSRGDIFYSPCMRRYYMIVGYFDSKLRKYVMGLANFTEEVGLTRMSGMVHTSGMVPVGHVHSITQHEFHTMGGDSAMKKVENARVRIIHDD